MSDQPVARKLDALALDSMHFLFSTLRDMKSLNPLAGMLEDQLNQEFAPGEVGMRLVGLVSFTLTSLSAKERKASELL